MGRRTKVLELVKRVTVEEKAAVIYADHLEELFEVIVPEKIGSQYQAALEREDMEKAAALCAAHFRAKPGVDVQGLSEMAFGDVERAEKTVRGQVRVVNIDWEFPNGEIDFLFNPTLINGPVNHEWLWQLNRHDYWLNLATVYQDTKDEKYARVFEKQLLHWIAQTYVPENWNGPGSAWRTIECGIRLLNAWPSTFNRFKNCSAVSDLTLLLMIASMHRQSLHLVAHPTKANWLMMEANGIYTFSALFPELKDAGVNRKIAAEHLLREMKEQILPDGMHNELSPDYQRVVLNCSANFYSLAKRLGLEGEISEEFARLIRNTVMAAIHLSTPAFTQPRTNDTFTIFTNRFTRCAEEMFGSEPEYQFVNTCREKGAPPAGETASVFLPYAGFAVMRSDWTQDATYLCFDVGPLGRAHMHQDKLNINIYKGEEELLYDDGGGQYELSDARTYAISGYGHNIVLVDGCAQQRKEPLEVSEAIDADWFTGESYDYAAASYDDVYGEKGEKPAVHTREVLFCKPGFFCVKDRMQSADGNVHDYEVLFHVDTTIVKPLEEYPGAMITQFGRKYELLILPLEETAEEDGCCLKVVSAQMEPFQGWYNGRNESNLHKAATVSREVKGVKDHCFTTLLFPVVRGQELPIVRKRGQNRVEVLFEGKEYCLNTEDLKANF